MARLPEDLLRQRLIHELRSLLELSRHDVRLEEGALDRLPVRLWIGLKDAPGPVLRQGQVQVQQDHRLLVEVGRDYPYERPTVIWATDIFHPNIMVPSDGGFVCTGLLEGWNPRSTLLGFVQGIEVLLAHPNPTSPFGTASCTAAAAHFNGRPVGSGTTPSQPSSPSSSAVVGPPPSSQGTVGD